MINIIECGNAQVNSYQQDGYFRDCEGRWVVWLK